MNYAYGISTLLNFDDLILSSSLDEKDKGDILRTIFSGSANVINVDYRNYKKRHAKSCKTKNEIG